MNTTQITPVVGNWYANKTGQLFKVKLVGYTDKKIKNVILEYLNGFTKKITIEDWNYLELSIPGANKKTTEGVLN